MTAFAITILTILFYVGVIALVCWLVVWALGQFGIPVPARAVQIGAALLVIALVIYILRSGLLPALP